MSYWYQYSSTGIVDEQHFYVDPDLAQKLGLVNNRQIVSAHKI
jgi:hypothetical protein